MGFNDLMHPRNIYSKSPPDFKILAEKFEYLRRFAKETSSGNFSLNFKDPGALRALTCALLEQDFGLKLNIPLDRLIPTVPLRLNYILWIEDLLSCLSKVYRHGTVRGFDVGTGASCIYPLLGAKLNGWHFLATEVDESSVSFAEENVKSNGLESKIRVKQVTHNSFLRVPLQHEEHHAFDFCMCNPPFFVSEFEASHGTTRSEKRPQPAGICTGTQTETVTGGGEVEFVKEMIKDSLILKEQISWYTSMLGKKSSLSLILAYLQDNNVKTITTTEFCQGQTMRWGVGWSFLPDVVVQESPSKRRKRAKKAKPLQVVVPSEFLSSQARTNEQLTAADRVLAMANYVKNILEELKVIVTEDKGKVDKTKRRAVFQCRAIEKTWANQRRKRREKLRQDALHESGACNENKAFQQDVDAFSKEDVSNPTGTKADDPFCDVLKGAEVPCKGSASCDVASKQDQTDPRPLVSFIVRVGTGAEIGGGLPSESVVLEMTWIDGQEKNDLYQLFQFFQNKLSKGL